MATYATYNDVANPTTARPPFAAFLAPPIDSDSITIPRAMAKPLNRRIFSSEPSKAEESIFLKTSINFCMTYAIPRRVATAPNLTPLEALIASAMAVIRPPIIMMAFMFPFTSNP